MKREQICPHCGKPIPADAIRLPIIKKRRLPDSRILCPNCKTHLESRLFERIETIFICIFYVGVLFVIIAAAHRYSLPVRRDSIWDKIVFLMIIPSYWIFLRIASAFASLIPPQKQVLLLWDKENKFKNYKPLYQSCYRLSDPGFQKEFVIDNILQIRNEKMQIYIQLKKVSDSGECEFHPVPYPKDALEFPEQAELWNGEEVVGTLEYISLIG